VRKDRLGKIVFVRVKPDLYRQLDQIAERSHRSRSDATRLLLEMAVSMVQSQYWLRPVVSDSDLSGAR